MKNAAADGAVIDSFVSGRHGEQQIVAINKIGLLACAMSQSILGRVDEWRHLVPGNLVAAAWKPAHQGPSSSISSASSMA